MKALLLVVITLMLFSNPFASDVPLSLPFTEVEHCMDCPPQQAHSCCIQLQPCTSCSVPSTALILDWPSSTHNGLHMSGAEYSYGKSAPATPPPKILS